MAKIDDIIKELNNISPMPDDDHLTKEVLIKYEVIIRKMALIKDPKCIFPLINSFGYGEANGLYWTVIHLLEEFEIEQVDPLLIESLSNGEKGTKMWAAYMLGRSRNNNAVDELIKLLKDTNELIRHNAAMALGMIGDNKAIPYLKEIKNDNSYEVRVAVERALDSL
jgi:HEAT repeat protein